MSKKVKYLIVGIVILLVVAGSWFFLQNKAGADAISKKASTNNYELLQNFKNNVPISTTTLGNNIYTVVTLKNKYYIAVYDTINKKTSETISIPAEITLLSDIIGFKNKLFVVAYHSKKTSIEDVSVYDLSTKKWNINTILPNADNDNNITYSQLTNLIVRNDLVIVGHSSGTMDYYNPDLNKWVNYALEYNNTINYLQSINTSLILLKPFDYSNSNITPGQNPFLGVSSNGKIFYYHLANNNAGVASVYVDKQINISDYASSQYIYDFDSSSKTGEMYVSYNDTSNRKNLLRLSFDRWYNNKSDAKVSIIAYLVNSSSSNPVFYTNGMLYFGDGNNIRYLSDNNPDANYTDNLGKYARSVIDFTANSSGSLFVVTNDNNYLAKRK